MPLTFKQPGKYWRLYKITCINCGSTAMKSNPSKTCSLECRESVRRKRILSVSKTEACPVCGTVGPLWKKVHDLHVCSKRCGGIIYERKRRVRDWPAWKKAVVERRAILGTHQPCQECGTMFTMQRYDRKFCSTKCGDKWANRDGLKGINLRKKLAAKRKAHELAIGHCALCKTSHVDIKPAKELGRRSKTGAAKFHRDHITPKNKGGMDSPENRRYLCWFCNLSRMDMDSKHDHAIAAAGAAFWKAIS